MIEVVPATLAHAHDVACGMREADRLELWALCRYAPADACRDSVALSQAAWAGLVDGRAACIFGVAAPTLLSETGSPWLLSSEAVVYHQTAFLRRNRRYINRMKALFPRLENYVHAGNELSIRWLTWLGFKMGEPQPFGVDGDLFRRFTMGI